MTSIWDSTNTAVVGTIRIPVDTAVDGSPAHVLASDLLDYIESNYNLTFDASGTGLNSVSIKATTADTEGSIAIGNLAEATLGTFPIAVGNGAIAYNARSVAIGWTALAGDAVQTSYEESVAIGPNARSVERHTVAIGRNALADGTNCIAVGDDADAGGDKAVAVGNTAIASGDRAIAIGSNAEATHANSIAMGELVSSSGATQFTFGDLLLRLGSFNIAGLPAATSYTGHVAYVTDGDAGSPCLAASNGTDWLRISLGSAVSSS